MARLTGPSVILACIEAALLSQKRVGDCLRTRHRTTATFLERREIPVNLRPPDADTQQAGREVAA